MNNRINRFKTILWVVLGAGIATLTTRLIFGLGSITNQSDYIPWAFWKGENVLGGIALSAGGFVIAGLYYIFAKKEFHGVARAAVATALLGYLSSATALLTELGLPWDVWRVIIHWNIHSPLFEVAWCVMIYLTILILEFAPMILEKFAGKPFLNKTYKLLEHKLKIALVILGIAISTLHQSSLGSIFLSMPYRLHPLWYSPIISVIFFLSAIYVGFNFLMVENLTVAYLYKRPFNFKVLNSLRKASLWGLLVYGAVRIGDLLIRGGGFLMFESGAETWLFWVEIALSMILPLVFFLPKKYRENPVAYFCGALSAVLGVVFHRINVGGLVHLNNLNDKIGSFYFPTWEELSISFGIISAAILAFLFFIEKFKIWENKALEEPAKPKKPVFDSFNVYTGLTKARNRAKFSLAFAAAFAVAFASMSAARIESDGARPTPTYRARNDGDTLFIDGNRDNYGVVFAHQFHIDNGVKCGYCHHLRAPGDEITPCFECHKDMYRLSDVFDHDWHSSSSGANLKCFECHSRSVSKGKDYLGDKKKIINKCEDCHKNIVSPDAEIKFTDYMAPSYADAMHKLCVNCHAKELKAKPELAARKPNLDKCASCHKLSRRKFFSEKERPSPRKINKWVVVPASAAKLK